MNQTPTIYQDMARRTARSIYIGVVGPVRTGKSTFIKRFMETQVLPNISDGYRRDRARDELPQSGSGRTIMTAEPKFVPEEAVEVRLEDGSAFSVRMIDCVGYMVPGAVGQTEDLSPRMVMTPWYDYELPMTEAAEIGTRKVITEHSTVGVVVTTDGTVTDIPREDYREAEERVIRELQEIGKPFVVLVNSAKPQGAPAQAVARDLEERCHVQCLCVNCQEMDQEAMLALLQGLLYEFPLQELNIFLPPWVEALPGDHPIKCGLYQALREQTKGLGHIRDLEECLTALAGEESISGIVRQGTDLGTGAASVEIHLPRKLFYETLSQRSGLTVADDGDLMEQLTELAAMKQEYAQIAPALQAAREQGYGIVPPRVEELRLEDPEIVHQGGRYGVRLKASAPTIHLIRADIDTTVSPMVGSEKQSEDMMNYLLQEFEGDPGKLWQSNIFGRSFHEIVGDDLRAKLGRMPEDSQEKLRQALERIINEGGGGLLCIIL